MDHEEFLYGDGTDPGLSESAYDGAEYEMDDFGERIGSEDLAEESMSEDEMVPAETAAPSGDGFGETLIPDADQPAADDIQGDHILEDPKFEDKIHEAGALE